MGMKWCPKCRKLLEKVNRVFSVAATWDDEEGDYRSTVADEAKTGELYDTCIECGAEVEELLYAKGEEDRQVV